MNNVRRLTGMPGGRGDQVHHRRNTLGSVRINESHHWLPHHGYPRHTVTTKHYNIALLSIARKNLENLEEAV